jgi:hypothetical protein
MKAAVSAKLAEAGRVSTQRRSPRLLIGPDIGVNILTIQHIVLNGDPADAESSRVE